MTDFQAAISKFDAARVLLIGDTILDTYTYGTALGLSAETPTIVARRKEERHSLGGAALVCRNMLELGASVHFLTLVGADAESAVVRDFSAPKLQLSVVTDAGRPTTMKQRFWVDGYKLFQLDQRDDSPICSAVASEIIDLVKRALREVDFVVISDYRHGLLTAELISSLMEMFHASGKLVYVDSQVSQTLSNHKLYRGGCVMVLNLKEARCIDPAFSPGTDATAFAVLNRELDTDHIVVKLGEDGSMVQKGGRVFRQPADKVTVTDTTGAGDSFLSALCLAGLGEPESALRLANAWAGLSVQIHGTIPPRKRDLLRAVGA
ncbi:MAG TPA: PfkB family carbohydrate kinase [Acidobacteriaceae bacterium]